MARPTKLTKAVCERILPAIRAGTPVESACRAAAIAPATFYRWLERGERESDGIYHDFVQEVRQAEAEAEVHAVATIRRAMAEDWRAALAYLERRHPSRWRKQTSSEITGRDGGPIRAEHSKSPDLSRLSDDELALVQELYARAMQEEDDEA